MDGVTAAKASSDSINSPDTAVSGGFFASLLLHPYVLQPHHPRAEPLPLFQLCQQRVTLPDTHSPPDLLRNNNAPQIVNTAHDPCSFHSRFLPIDLPDSSGKDIVMLWKTWIVSAVLGKVCRPAAGFVSQLFCIFGCTWPHIYVTLITENRRRRQSMRIPGCPTAETELISHYIPSREEE